MKQSKLFLLLAVLLCATTTGWAQTWLGSGNSAAPYLLKSSNEWEALAYTWLDQDGQQPVPCGQGMLSSTSPVNDRGLSNPALPNVAEKMR